MAGTPVMKITDSYDGFYADETWQASWIWGPETPHGSNGWFRRSFELKTPPDRAIIQCSADDSFTLYVNGTQVLQDGFWWRTTILADVTALLRAGGNTITAHVANAAHPGGLLLQADIWTNGIRTLIATDRNWQFRSSEPQANWMRADSPNTGWQPCVETGPPPVGPWGPMPLAWTGPRDQVQLVQASHPARVQAGTAWRVVLTVKPLKPLPASSEWMIRLVRKGVTLSQLTLPVTDAHRRKDGSWTVTAQMTTPRYALPGVCELHAGIRHTQYAGKVQGHMVGRIDLIGAPDFGKLTHSEVRTPHGIPTLYVNGQAEPSLWFWHVRPGRDDAAHIKEMGIRTLTLSVDLGWRDDHTYDYSTSDATIMQALEGNPNIWLVPRIMMNAPAKWLAKYPDEAIQYADGAPPQEDGFGGTWHESFASERWQHDAEEALRQWIDHNKKAPWSSRIIGIHVANGIYGEWHAWSAPHMPDTSEPMRRWFVRWAHQRYHTEQELQRAWNQRDITWDRIRIPTLEERLSGDQGPFRNPATARWIADYYAAFHDATASAIERLTRAVKQASNNHWITVVFYGYLPDLDWAQEGDHRAIDRIIRSPWVDAFSSPHTYERRKQGQDGLFRAYPGSHRIHKKLFIDEADDRTHRADDPTFTHVTDESGSIGLVKRQFGNTITHGVGLWYMDQQGAWFYTPAIKSAIRSAVSIHTAALERPNPRRHDVALIVCPTSDFYMSGRTSGRDTISVQQFVGLFGEMARAGAPYDVFLLEDLLEGRVPHHRFTVVLNAWYLDDTRRNRLHQQVMRDGATVLWMVAPGWLTPAGFSLDAMQQLTGWTLQQRPEIVQRAFPTDPLRGVLPFGSNTKLAPAFTPADPAARIYARFEDGAAALASKKVGGAHSVFSTLPTLPAAVLAHLYREAGVHCYTDPGTPVSASERWLSVHAATDGPIRITLPGPCTVVDAFSRQRIGAALRTFTVNMRLGETRVFQLTP